jgi:DNA-directed RNA polymerase specialized sigma24 family protein
MLGTEEGTLRESIERARGGDADAFTSAVAGHVDRLYAAAYLILRDRHAAEDAVQDGLLNAWRAMPSLPAWRRSTGRCWCSGSTWTSASRTSHAPSTLPEGTVKSRLHNATKAMRSAIGEIEAGAEEGSRA